RGDVLVFDNDTNHAVRGFGIRKYADGRASSFVKYLVSGQPRRHTWALCARAGQRHHSSDQVFGIINAVPRADCDLLFGGGERLWRGWSAAKAALDKRINEAAPRLARMTCRLGQSTT